MVEWVFKVNCQGEKMLPSFVPFCLWWEKVKHFSSKRSFKIKHQECIYCNQNVDFVFDYHFVTSDWWIIGYSVKIILLTDVMAWRGQVIQHMPLHCTIEITNLSWVILQTHLKLNLVWKQWERQQVYLQ